VKTRGVIGKRIVAVHQQHTHTNYGKTVYHVDALELEDGSLIVFDVLETGAEYIIEGKHQRRRRA